MKFKTIIGDKTIANEQIALGNKSWPEFMQHDAVVEKYWPNLYSDFLEFQFAAFLEGIIAGVGNAIPVYWDDNFNKLPSRGLDWAMEKAVSDYKKELTPNLLVAVQILINPELQGMGLSYKLLDQMKQIAKNQGMKYIALPVRPTQKHLHALTSMEDYIKWTDQKGQAFDPWIRVHMKAGGEIARICSESMTIRGTVKDWEEWTGLTFQSSGQYIVEKALSPVNIDIEKDIGEYIEPNVWIIHSS